MGTSFLCWNINKKRNFEAEIARIVLLPEIVADILLLIEAENVNDEEVENLTTLKRIQVNDNGNEPDYELTPRFYSRLSIKEFQL